MLPIQEAALVCILKKHSVFAVIIRTIIAMNIAIDTTMIMIMIVKLAAKRILFIKGSFAFTPLISKHSRIHFSTIPCFLIK